MVAGEAAVVANTNAAAAYLLGAERLFENAPKVVFEEVEVRSRGTRDPTMDVAVMVKDGEDAVKCSAEKVKELFEATSDLRDWADGGRAGTRDPTMTVTVDEPVVGDSAATMRFSITPHGDENACFIRVF